MMMRIRINSKLKIKTLLQRRIPACRLPAGRQGRQAPSEEKVQVKSNVIARSEATKQSLWMNYELGIRNEKKVQNWGN